MYLTCRSAKRSIITLLPLLKVVKTNAWDSCTLYNFHAYLQMTIKLQRITEAERPRQRHVILKTLTGSVSATIK